MDTGAEITVVPGDFVYDGQILPDTVEIVGATGVLVSTKTATLEFEVAGISFDKVVAVASPEMMCQRILYSVPMPKDKAKQLLVDACKSEASTSLQAAQDESSEVRVVTRNQKKKAEVAEEVAQAQDKVGVVVKDVEGTKEIEDPLLPSVMEKVVHERKDVVQLLEDSKVVSENIVSNMKKEETVVQGEESEEAPDGEVATSCILPVLPQR